MRMELGKEATYVAVGRFSLSLLCFCLFGLLLLLRSGYTEHASICFVAPNWAQQNARFKGELRTYSVETGWHIFQFYAHILSET